MKRRQKSQQKIEIVNAQCIRHNVKAVNKVRSHSVYDESRDPCYPSLRCQRCATIQQGLSMEDKGYFNGQVVQEVMLQGHRS